MKTPPTVVMCGNDVLAVGALMKAREMGLRVPEDVSITGFDDIELAEVVDPPLTTVHVPHRQMGRQAARVLVYGINNTSEPAREKLRTHIAERASLGLSRPEARPCFYFRSLNITLLLFMASICAMVIQQEI